MQINSEMKRNERSIGSKEAGSVKVQVPLVYVSGQTIGDGEAAMLNQTIAENVSNNLRDKIVAYVPAAPEGQPYSDTNPAPAPRLATAEEAQAIVDAYLTAYTPGVRAGGSGAPRLTPLDRKVREIATSKLVELLTASGKKRKDVKTEDFNALREKIIAQHGTALEKKAQALLDAEAKAVDTLSGGEDILAQFGASLDADEAEGGEGQEGEQPTE